MRAAQSGPAAEGLVVQEMEVLVQVSHTEQLALEVLAEQVQGLVVRG